MEVSAEPGKDGRTGGRFDGRTLGQQADFLRDGVDSGQTFRAAGVDSVASCASAAEGHESSSSWSLCAVGVGEKQHRPLLERLPDNHRKVRR